MLALAGGHARAQNTAPRERSAYVSVVDAIGKPVTGLTQSDFVVREDGVAREVLRVGPATAPIEITVMVDTSDRAGPFVADIRRALTGFVREMAKGNEIAITSFGGPPATLQSYTSNVAQLEKGIGRIFAEQGSGAYLLEALQSVAGGATKRAPERAVILAILVRSAPEFSNVPHESVVDALRNCGAAFDAITIQAGGEPPTRGDVAAAVHDRDIVLDEASRATGGRNDQALSGLSLDPLMKSIAAELRAQYRVVYARPESLIPPEKIQVSVKTPGLTVRATPIKAPH